LEAGVSVLLEGAVVVVVVISEAECGLLKSWRPLGVFVLARRRRVKLSGEMAAEETRWNG